VTRDPYKSVTSKESFVLVVPASPKEATGEATFQMDLGAPQPIRAVTEERGSEVEGFRRSNVLRAIGVERRAGIER
jgi:hypothetical protein